MAASSTRTRHQISTGTHVLSPVASPSLPVPSLIASGDEDYGDLSELNSEDEEYFVREVRRRVRGRSPSTEDEVIEISDSD